LLRSQARTRFTGQMGHSISRPERVAVEWTHRPTSCFGSGGGGASPVYGAARRCALQSADGVLEEAHVIA
jgi:hypothetical protein